MKNKRLFPIIMASLMSISMMTAFPMGASALTSYTGLISTDTTNSAPSNDAWLQYTIYSYSNSITATEDLISYNATEFKKVLEIEDTANIPACSFTYTVTAPDSNIPATYNDDSTIKTLAVFPGVNASAIQYKLETVSNNAFDTGNNASSSYSTTGLTSTDGTSVTLSYSAQAVSLPDSGTKSVGDNVLINNITPTDGSEDTYYAIKTIQMDFTNCGFTEPGIYRYYIEETGDNQGITNDYAVTGDNSCWRTIDVYVEDATYTTTDETTTNNKLRIAGYVMYVGKQTAGPQAGNATITSITPDTMEDGLKHTNPSGMDGAYGGANGLEIKIDETTSATKSEGIKNLYETSDITFKKTVSGNQASKDKFFKFNIKLTPDGISNVGDNDVFIINGTQVYNLDTTQSDAKPNSATPYLSSTINTQNSANPHTDADGNYIYVTGAELKAENGYDFYLQDGQYVTIQGLPNGIGYELKEWQDDYTPTVQLLSTDAGKTYDNKNGGTDGDDITAPTISIVNNVNDNPGNTASIKDTKITDDVYATFNNERKGVLPTGIILSVGPTAIIGLALVGGILFLVVRNKKRKLEE